MCLVFTHTLVTTRNYIIYLHVPLDSYIHAAIFVLHKTQHVVMCAHHCDYTTMLIIIHTLTQCVINCDVGMLIAKIV